MPFSLKFIVRKYILSLDMINMYHDMDSTLIHPHVSYVNTTQYNSIHIVSIVDRYIIEIGKTIFITYNY